MLISKDHPLLLASASPRRRELLQIAGIACEVRSVDIDETVHAGETATDYLARIVQAKLTAATALATPSFGTTSYAGLLVADTSVVVDGRVLGKPEDDEEGRQMIALLAGRAHEVSTRFAVRENLEGREHAQTVTTRVHVSELSADAISSYVRLGEGRDKAGGYGIQGRFGSAIHSIDGSYSNVVGLPVSHVLAALVALGLALNPFGTAES